jgi:chromosome segregation ATPase
MWNPLTIAAGAVSVAANLPRAIESVARSADLLERANAQAAALNERADDARELMQAGLERMDAMNERAGLVLQELAEAREVFAAAMLKFDRGTNELVAAREQLRESQGALAEAHGSVQRALEMAEPLDRMTTRAARIAGSLRRDPDGD